MQHKSLGRKLTQVGGLDQTKTFLSYQNKKINYNKIFLSKTFSQTYAFSFVVTGNKMEHKEASKSMNDKKK